MKHSFKNTNTIVIQGWMINELKLSGNELILYALIYGFSQDGESEFYGSLNYVSTALNCSKPTVIKALNSLIDKNLIYKNQNSINGIVYSKYSVNQIYFNGSKETLLVKNNDLGSKETLRGSKETLPNNNIYNNIYNNKESTLFQNDLEDESLKTKKEKEKQAKEKFILFSESIWNSYEYLRSYLKDDLEFVEKYAGVDLKNYIEDCLAWSVSKNNKSTNNGWLLTLKKWMRDDLRNGTLKKLKNIPNKKNNKDGHINW